MTAKPRSVYTVTLKDGTSHEIIADAGKASASNIYRMLKLRLAAKGQRVAELDRIRRTG